MNEQIDSETDERMQYLAFKLWELAQVGPGGSITESAHAIYQELLKNFDKFK